MSRYFIYARKSSEDDDRQALSIESQLKELRDYASKNSLCVIDEYTESKSARKPGRVVFNQMLMDIEAGKADGILSWSPDRLSRGASDGGKIIQMIDDGIIADLKFPSYFYENTPHGKFNLSIAFGFSKMYTDRMVEDIKRGIREKVRRGEFPGKAPVGYYNHPKTRTIEPDSEKFDTIKYFLEKFAEGNISQARLREEMYEAGIRSRKGHVLGYFALRWILTNCFYYGVFKLKGEIHQGSHKPMISKETFDKIQAVLNRNPRKVDWSKANKSKKDFLFSGLARCGECGYAMTQEWHRKKSGLVFKYYRCTRKSKTYSCNQDRYLREEDLTGQVENIASGISLNDELFEKLTRMAAQMHEYEKSSSQETIQKLNESLEQIKSKLNRLLDLQLEGELNLDEYKEKKNALMNEKANLESRKSEFEVKGSRWFEPVNQLLKSSNRLYHRVKEKNFHEINSILSELGLNSTIRDKKLDISFLEPLNLLSEVLSLTSTCSSTEKNHFSEISESQLPGRVGKKELSRQRPTARGTGVTDCPSDSEADCLASAELRLLSEIWGTDMRWLYMKEYEPTGWQG